jgi:trimeric autotransporter adhesin
MTRLSQLCIPRWTFILCILVAVSAALGNAQTNYGAVRGLVSDPQGAVVPNASVMVMNEQTKVTRSTVTNTGGEYLFTALDPGTYTISITANGFDKLQQKTVVVSIGTTQTVDATLKTGDVMTEVVVNGDTGPMIDTATASEGQTFDTQKLQDLPNLGRNPFVFEKLDNNATPTGDPRFVRAEDQSGTTGVSVAGAPIGSTSGANAANNYVVDGIPVSTSAGGATFIPSLEAISDAKVEADTYDAEVGRSGGGVFNTTLKSGSSSYHGTLYGETRQTGWAANAWSNKLVGIDRPDSTTYLYAGAFGGPVPLSHKVKLLDNTFFWVTEEGYRQAQPYTSSTDSYYLPTPSELAGDFSHDSVNGVPITIYDPTQPFVGGVRVTPVSYNGAANVIPPNLINPIGQFIAKQYPACNYPSTSSCANYTGSGAYNFVSSNDFKTRSDMYSGKIDHVFTRWWSGSASYVHLATQEPTGNILQVFAENDGVIHRFNDATAVNNVFTLSPTMVLTVGYGFNRYYSDTLQYSSGFNQTNGFGGAGFPESYVSQLQSATFPSITLSGVTDAAALGAATSGPTVNASKNLVVGIVKTIGKHNLKGGYVFRSMNEFVSAATGANGAFTFDGMYSDQSGGSVSNGPNAIADLLMGLPGSSSTAASTTINAVGLRMNEKYNALYAQDDYRVTEKLTVNLGLRYEFELGQTEASNRYNVGFDPNISYTFPSAAAPTAHGGLAFAAVDGYPNHCCDESHLKFSPRFGAAYQLKKGTVIRGGVGIFYAGVSLSPYSTGYSQTTAYINASTSTALTGADSGVNAWLSNPFPTGLLQPSGNSLAALSGVGGAITAQSFSRRFPLVDQYSMDIEQQLPAGFALKVGYVGAHARNWGQNVGLDQVPDSMMASYAPGGANYGMSLATKVANPYYAAKTGGYPSTGVISNANVQQAQLLIPYPQFSGVTLIESNGKSRYNALDIKVQKAMGKGLTILATYTWSSNWDNLYGSTSTLNSSTNGLQDNYDLPGEYARSINDMPNRFTAAISYAVPIGRGEPYFSGMNRWLDYALGGWQLNDEWIDQNGSPLAITQTNLNSAVYGAVGGSTQRPNLVPGVNPCYSGRPESRIGGPHNLSHPYFNINAFSLAPAYTYGDAPRTVSCKGPGYDNSDISMFKNFKTLERVNFQVRVEALNTFNTAELGTPNTTITGVAQGTNASTGSITSSLGFGRIIQLGGRITF